ncbi:MAG: class I SAM-dependent methyltransferase [Planctomycetota bacterium]
MSKVPEMMPSARSSERPAQPERHDRYVWAARVYDLATAGWTGGAIWKTRAFAIEEIIEGSRIVVPGGGTGRDALAAARRGAHVTLVDRSPAMLRRAQARIARAPTTKGSIELIEADLFEWSPAQPVDGVLASHILNVYGPIEMRALRARLLGWLAPGGRLWVADFAPLRGPAPLRALQRLAHILPLGGCAWLTGNALHPIYDHGAELAREGLPPSHTRDARVFTFGPRWYRTWTFPAPPADPKSGSTGGAGEAPAIS